LQVLWNLRTYKIFCLASFVELKREVSVLNSTKLRTYKLFWCNFWLNIFTDNVGTSVCTLGGGAELMMGADVEVSCGCVLYRGRKVLLVVPSTL